MVSFKRQFDKLTAAYINDEVNPYDNCACFIGNMLNCGSWGKQRVMSHFGNGDLIDPSECIERPFCLSKSDVLYSIKIIENAGFTREQINNLEETFLQTLYKYGGNQNYWQITENQHGQTYEDALFLAFEKTLNILRDMYVSNGWPMGEEVETKFVKRQLQNA